MGFSLAGKGCLGLGIFVFFVGAGLAYKGYSNAPDMTKMMGDMRMDMSNSVKANGAAGDFQIEKSDVNVGGTEMVNELTVSMFQFCGAGVASVRSCPHVIITNAETGLPPAEGMVCVANPNCQCTGMLWNGTGPLIRYDSSDQTPETRTICTISTPVIGKYSYDTKECLPATVDPTTGLAPAQNDLACSGGKTQISIVATNRQMAAANPVILQAAESAANWLHGGILLSLGFTVMCWTALCYECCGVCAVEDKGDHDGWSDDESGLNQ